MKVILLAAGLSRRAKPIEDKNFIRFCGKFLIEHQIEVLRASGFRDILIIGGTHNGNRLKKLARALSKQHRGLKLNVVTQLKAETGMAGAILAAERKVKKNEPVLIVSGNDIVEPGAYQNVSKAIQSADVDGALLAKKVKEYFPGGYLKVGREGRIERIIEKPGAGKEPSRLVNLVVHAHRSAGALFDALKKAKTSRDDRYEVALDQLVRNGACLKAVPYNGQWRTIKYPWHVLDLAENFLKNEISRRSPSAQIDPKATIHCNVTLEDNVKVFAGATIIGPAHIGKNSIIGTNALIRESTLGENCVIGYNTEVTRSVLGDDVWTHSNYIGDSIIGDDVAFGAGCVTGNLRFDEGPVRVAIEGVDMDSGHGKLGLFTGNHIRVGVNTSFMPGTKIGSNTGISAGLTLHQDIPENSFVKGKISLDIVPNKKPELKSRHEFRKKLK